MGTRAARLLDRMKTLPADGPWTRIGASGFCVRWSIEKQVTPDWAKVSGAWPGETFDSHVFLTVSAGSVFLRAAHAPWVRSDYRKIPLWLAEAVLDDPALGLDSDRQRVMREERRSS